MRRRASGSLRLMAGVSLSLLVLGAAGCQRMAANRIEQSVATSVEASRTEYESAEALAAAALKAIQAKDETALQTMRISEETYREIYYPDFVKTKPRHTVPVEFHWKTLCAGSTKGLRRLLADHGGENLQLVRVIPEEIKEYENCRVWSHVLLEVSRREGGDTEKLRVFSSLFESGGKYSALGYVD